MFKKAERKKIKLKLAITGPTGSGKSFSALRLAKGLGGKVAVIDTENGSASLYSDKFDFDVLDMKPPFTTEKYIEAINSAEKAGYEIIVIDSLTHAWAGEGGLLEQKAVLDSRPGSNHWTNWGPIEKKDAALKNAYLHSNCHIISTMRSKMDYAQTDENGKKKIQKLGMAPIARDGLTYEFTTVFDIAMDHKAETSKDRTGLFTDRIFQITEETGEEIKKWIDSGAEIKPDPKPQQKAVETKGQNPTSVNGVAATITNPVATSADPTMADHLFSEDPPLFSESDMIDEIIDLAKAPEKYIIDTGGPNLEGKELSELSSEQIHKIIVFLIKIEKPNEKQKRLLYEAKKFMGV